MQPPVFTSDTDLIAALDAARPVLIAGPTASGKSALALAIAEQQGGVIVNADASQVYDCWRILTARPSLQDEARAPHRLYGHQGEGSRYSVGHWLREVAPLLAGAPRPIIVGGTGLYFQALLNGLAEIPPVPAHVRDTADGMPLDVLSAGLDADTKAGIDMANRARVQRAWEVQTATGKSLRDWQMTAAATPLLTFCAAQPVAFDVSRDWLNARIERRFDQMLALGALDEVQDLLPRLDPSRPAHRAIGATQLAAYLKGEITLDAARTGATIATRRYAKRQRTWIRNKMQHWMRYIPPM